MTHAEAAFLLERMTSADTDPWLSMDDIDALLLLARRPDRDGRNPDDPAWIETWDLNVAAAEGWRWKAGKVAERFAFSADGASYNRDQVWQHCQTQAAMYSRRVVSAFNPNPNLIVAFPFEEQLP